MNNINIVDLAQETKKLSAVIVECDALTGEILHSTLKNFFNEVTVTLNTNDTLDACKKSTPDVIFMNLDNSQVDEAELSSEIYKVNPKQIIVVISGDQDITKISNLIQVGISSFIPKPINTKKILELLNNIVNMISEKKKLETKTFSISLPLDVYEMVNDSAKAENISKNAIVIRGLRNFYT